jgi:hypothetical protein
MSASVQEDYSFPLFLVPRLCLETRNSARTRAFGMISVTPATF